MPKLRYSAEVGLAALVVCAAAVLPLLSTINAYFIGDDFGLIQLFSSKPPLHFLTLFTSPWTELTYGVAADELRPLVELSYQFDSLWGPGSPVGYHLDNIVLHAVSALLVLAIARHLCGLDWMPAAFAGMVFALLPAQAEVGAWISGRADSIPAVFYLGSLLAYGLWRRMGRDAREANSSPSGLGREKVRGSWPSVRTGALYGGSVLAFLLALFSKQSAITFLAALVAYDVLLERRLPWRPWQTVVAYAPFALLTASYLGLRFVLFGNAVREGSITGDTFVSLALIQGTFMQMLATGSLVMRPEDVVLPAIALAGLAGALLGVVVALPSVLSGRATRRLGALLYFGPVWWVITVAPLAVTYVSARHLYLTAAGFAIVLGIVFGRLWDPKPETRNAKLETLRRTVAVVAGAGLLVFYAISLSSAVEAWNASAARSLRMAQDLWREAVAAPPGSLVVIDAPASNAPIRKWRGTAALVFFEESRAADPAAWTFIWSWAAPFLYGPPFAPTDLTARVAFVEPPGVYCCPEEQWFQRTQDTVRAWRERADGASMVALTWDEAGRLARGADDSSLEAALDRILDAKTPDEASRLLEALFRPLRR